MLGSRITTGLLVVWTVAMATWLVVYQGTDATCGPEIYRNCQIGLRVTPGLGRPGIVLLWALGVVALAMTWLTTRPGSKARRRAERLYAGFRPPAAGSPRPGRRRRPRRPRRPLPAWLAGRGRLAAVVAPVALLAGVAAALLPASSAPVEGVRVQVLSAILRDSDARSAGGPAPARLVVRVRVANDGERAIANPEAVLLAETKTRADFVVSAASGALPQPLAPGSVAADTLRFEIAAPLADALSRARRAQLRFAGETVAFSFVVRRVPDRPATPDRQRAAKERRTPAAPAPPPPPRAATPPPPPAAAAPAPARRATPAPEAAPPPPPPRRSAPPPPPPPPPRSAAPPPPPPEDQFDDSG